MHVSYQFNVAFIVGIMNRDYETNAAHVHPSVINHWTGTCLAMSIAANRVSYIFNFTGPSLSLDCACSSSLVALHLACQSIKQGLYSSPTNINETFFFCKVQLIEICSVVGLIAKILFNYLLFEIMQRVLFHQAIVKWLFVGESTVL